MKKLLVMLLMFSVLSLSVFAASVNRDISPSKVAPGEDVTVTLSARGVPVGELFTIEESSPASWSLLSWDVQGYEGDVTDIDLRTVDNRRGYSFTAANANPVVTLVFRVPSNAASQDYAFDAVYFDSTGQSRSQGSVTVRVISCGDGVCEGDENSDSCSEDCQAPAPPADTTPAESDTPEETPEGTSGSGAIIVFAIVVVVALVGFFLYTKKGKKK